MATVIDNSLSILDDLNMILSSVNNEQAEKLVDLIIEAKRNNKKVYCAGAGRSLLMIRSFSMRLMHLGLRSYVVGETSTPAIEKEDVLIFGSGSGETGALTIMIKKAQQVGAEIVLITRNPKSTLGSQSQIILTIPIENGRSGFQPSGSTFEQGMLILCDALVLRIMEKENVLADGCSIDSYIMRFHANLE